MLVAHERDISVRAAEQVDAGAETEESGPGCGQQGLVYSACAGDGDDVPAYAAGAGCYGPVVTASFT